MQVKSRAIKKFDQMLEQLFLKWMEIVCYRIGDNAYTQSISRKDLCASVALKKPQWNKTKKN